jgi:hypothetical protein
VNSWIGGLLPGTYTVDASTDTGRRVNATFTVVDLGDDPTPIRVELR